MFNLQSSDLSINLYTNLFIHISMYLFSILNPGTHGPAILSMSTFGKDGREINLDMVDSNRNRSVNPTGIYLYRYLSFYLFNNLKSIFLSNFEKKGVK